MKREISSINDEARRHNFTIAERVPAEKQVFETTNNNKSGRNSSIVSSYHEEEQNTKGETLHQHS